MPLPSRRRRSSRSSSRSIPVSLLQVWCLILLEGVVASQGRLYSFEVTHRFSDKARKELQLRHGEKFQNWPPQGSLDFHRMLFHFDLLRRRSHFHGHAASTKASLPLMANSIGNSTYYNKHDGLHYTYIEIGTPSQSYFVTLDTGSDLLWVPCAHCIACAPSDSSIYNVTFNIYNPSSSASYAQVTCASAYCDLANSCSTITASCPYHLQYLSPVSTDGYLVEDLMHLVPQKGGNKTATGVIFGCGTNQTGAFVNGTTVPDGLLGLGMRTMSVPSVLAQSKVIANSFSLCFDDGFSTGRLVLGDRGSSKAHSTAILKTSPVGYWVGLKYVLVGGVSVKTNTVAIFDSGTTYSYLATNAYNLVITAPLGHSPACNRDWSSSLKLDKEVPYRSVTSPFDASQHCYSLPNTDSVELPTITLKFSGGAKLEVLRPYAIIPMLDNSYIVCLNLMDSKSGYSIVGHNFMVNQSVTFDRVKNKITWIQVPSCDNYRTSFGLKSQGQDNWLIIAFIVFSSYVLTVRTQ